MVGLSVVLLVGGLLHADTPSGETRDRWSTEYQPAAMDLTYGVTIDRISDLDATVDTLNRLPRRLASRIVFDEFVAPQDYVDAVDRLLVATDLMGEILDSLYVKHYSVDEYAERTRAYVDTLGAKIGIWEVGNEINGDWVPGPGEPRSAVVDKVVVAHDMVKRHGGRTAITLFYNEGCTARPEHDMFTWVRNELPPSLKVSVDYVLVSYYQDACHDLWPDWQRVFEKLRDEFPSAQLGFGEAGVTDPSAPTERKVQLLRRYYATRPNVDGFIGGYFWWYFWQDMVMPLTRGDTEMVDALAAAIQS